MEELSVNKVAEMLGKTDRTIRNYIKEGRIKAKRIENQFGWEYQVYDLGEFSPAEEMQESTCSGKAGNRPGNPVENCSSSGDPGK